MTDRWPGPRAAGLEVVLLERAEGMRRLQRDRLGDRVRWVGDVSEAAPFDGLIVANELLDALPFRLYADGVEVLVGLERTAGSRRCPNRRRGRCGRSSGRRWRRWCAGSRARCAAGALLIDYAAVPGDPRDPVRTYIGGQRGGDPLQAPGTQDLTADVDFGEVRAVLGRRALESSPTSRSQTGCAATASSGHRSRAAPTTAGGWRACSTRRCLSACRSPGAL